jgi:hypothetical protein
MYVHLGGDLVVAVAEVVTIIDARTVAGSAVNQEFVRRAESSGRIRGGGATADCKSLVVTRDLAVYTSGLSPATLTRRMTHLRQGATAWDAET